MAWMRGLDGAPYGSAAFHQRFAPIHACHYLHNPCPANHSAAVLVPIPVSLSLPTLFSSVSEPTNLHCPTHLSTALFCRFPTICAIIPATASTYTPQAPFRYKPETACAFVPAPTLVPTALASKLRWCCCTPLCACWSHAQHLFTHDRPFCIRQRLALCILSGFATTTIWPLDNELQLFLPDTSSLLQAHNATPVASQSTSQPRLPGLIDERRLKLPKALR